MAVTIRIVVMDTDPLDGTTPLPAALDQFSEQDTELGLLKITLPIGLNFGRFDPGSVLLGQSGSYIVKHLTVTSAGGPHVAGSQMRLRPPPLPDNTFGPERTILDFGDVGLGDGVIPEGLFPPVPVAHELIFDTGPDGAAPGPHVIQFTLEAAQLQSPMSQEQIGVPGGDGDGDGDGDTFVYRPGGVPNGNVYTSFAVMVAAMALVAGPKIVEVDDAIVSPALIPVGAFDLRGAVFRGRPGAPQSVLRGSVGTTVSNLYRIEGNLQLENNDPAAALVTLADTEVFEVVDGASLASQVAAPVVEFTAGGTAVVRLQSGELVATALGPAIGANGGAGSDISLEVYEGSVVGLDTIESIVGSTVATQLRDFGATFNRTQTGSLGTNTFTTIPAAGSGEPDNDDLFDTGLPTKRWRTAQTRLLMANARGGGGTLEILYGANSVGLLQGSVYAPANGTARIQIAEPATQYESSLGVRARVLAAAYGLGEAFASAAGSKASGFVEAVTAHNARLRSTGIASRVHGYVSANTYDATLEATGIGSEASGYSASFTAPYGTARLRSIGKGSRAFGGALYFANIYADGDGAVAEGLAFGLGSREAEIFASGGGSRAQGMAAGGKLLASANGSFAGGYARRGDALYGSVIEATGNGSLAFGISNRDAATDGPAKISANAQGAVAMGVAYDANSLVQASGQASFAMGLAITYGALGVAEVVTLVAANGAWVGGLAGANPGFTARISSEENGTFALGKCVAITGDTYIRAYKEGSFSHGRAEDASILSLAQGSFAQGEADGNNIEASGAGSFAQGSSTAAAIIASAANSCQFGPGTNARADTLQVGLAGLAFKGSVGVPAVLQDGDFWVVGGGDVYCRTGGISKKLTNIT